MKVLAITLILVVSPATAQKTLELQTLQREARRADPRLQQLELEAARTELSLRNIEAERRPSLSLEGLAQYQSDVPEFPSPAPGAAGPSIPKDTFDASVRVEQSLLDPSARARAAVERARLAEVQAGIEAALYTLRQEVDEAFFSAALLQERAAQIETTITDLEARRRDAAARVREGTALRSEPATLEATLLQRRQELARLSGSRTAALARLAELTGRAITDADVLALPDSAELISTVRTQIETLRARPEYARFALARQRLDAQKEVLGAQEKPRVSAFGRAGYGQPGLNFLNDGFDAYWLAGVRVQWKPWNWGTTDRDQQLLELQKQSILADEQAFTRSLRRSLQNDLAALDRLAEVAALDDRIVALREEIERETRARYDEGVVTASEYVDRSTDVLESRLARSTHRLELAQAQARLLTALGLEKE